MGIAPALNLRGRCQMCTPLHSSCLTAQVAAFSACLFPCVLSSVPGSQGSLALHKHLIRINIQLDAASFSPPPWRRVYLNPTLSRAHREIFVPGSCPLITGGRPGELSPIWSMSGQLAPPVMDSGVGDLLYSDLQGPHRALWHP